MQKKVTKATHYKTWAYNFLFSKTMLRNFTQIQNSCKSLVISRIEKEEEKQGLEEHNNNKHVVL